MNGISFPTNCSGGIYMSGNRRLLKVHDGGEDGTARQMAHKLLIQESPKRRLGTFLDTGRLNAHICGSGQFFFDYASSMNSYVSGLKSSRRLR